MGVIVWSRLQVETADFVVAVPMGVRIVITGGISIAGLGSGFIVPLVLTRSAPDIWRFDRRAPRPNRGTLAWSNPARFIKETLF